MLKKLLLVVIASQVVVGGDLYEDDQPLNLKGGFVSSLSAEKYSGYRISCLCQDVPKIKSFYEELKNAEAHYIDKVTQDKTDKSRCYLNFKSPFVLDVIFEGGKDSIQKSITYMHNALYSIRKDTVDSIKPIDFIYDSAKKRFVYKNFGKLVNFFEKKKGNGLLAEDAAKLKLKKLMKIDDAIGWYSNGYNFDYQFDDNKVVEKNAFFDVETVEELSLDSSIQDNLNILKIGVNRDGKNWKVTTTLDSNTDSFSFSENKEVFSLYLCKKPNDKSNECINLKESKPQDPMTSMYWNFKVKKNQMIDIDIRHVNSLHTNVELNLFKVFFTLTDIASSRIVSRSPFQRDQIISDKTKKNFILIDNGTEEINLKDLQTNEYKKFRLKGTPLIIKADEEQELELFRISFLNIDNLQSELSHVSFKYYHLRIPTNHILVINDDKTDKFPNVYSFKTKDNYTYSSVYKCRNDYLISETYSFSSIQNIIYGQDKKSYDCDVNLIKEPIDQSTPLNFKTIKDNCLILQGGTDYQTYRYYHIGEYKQFEWNFNTEENNEQPNTTCNIYLRGNIDGKVPRFISSNFKFPEYKDKRIYLYIRTIDQKPGYIIRAFYFENKDNVYEILNINRGKYAFSKTIPEGYIFKLKNTPMTKEQSPKKLINETVNYQSSIEIIYSIDDEDILRCTRYFNIIIDSSNDIVFQCTNKNSAKDSEDPIESKPALVIRDKVRSTLKKVFLQASNTLQNII